jgi:hypothetical protein
MDVWVDVLKKSSESEEKLVIVPFNIEEHWRTLSSTSCLLGINLK